MDKHMTIGTLQRLPDYLNYLKSLPQNSTSNISATIIAKAIGLNDVLVRKDLASISNGGKPKIGYNTQELIKDIEHALGYDNVNNAVIVGTGNLGHALLSYEGFEKYGLDIVAGFDVDTNVIGTTVNGKNILDVHKLKNLCERMKIYLGIISVPDYAAQDVCDLMIESGIRAIWNFAPIHLNVPEYVLVQNENLGISFAKLSNHLSEKMFE